jgi:choline dehydrogenase-like flavoprotein
MESLSYIPEQPEQNEWDVVVIGTGMGGSTLGYALARRGHSVLFIEKGPLRGRTDGLRPEFGHIGSAVDNSPEARLSRGEWPLQLEGATSFGELKFFPPLGCGAGGTTALFSAALERLRPLDFRPRANFPHVTDSALPEAWPISYDEIAPHYDEAEKLFRVCGTPDPLGVDGPCSLRAPPPHSARDQHFLDSWTTLGLHPYRIHMGCEFIPDCAQCLGVLCPRDCKSDAKRICLMPALERFGAKILPECEVSRLEAGPERIERVLCRWNGREIAISGRIVVLAAGAWMTPAILLRSCSKPWPEGVANRSGQVGRNLMFHASDLIAVLPRQRGSTAGPVKAISLNDFYFCEGRKFGTFQSLGGSMNWGGVLWYLRSAVDKDPRWWRKLTRPFLPGVALIAMSYFKNAGIFATILEDLPYYYNRVLPEPKAESGIRFVYRYTDELRERNDLFRKRLAKSLYPHRIAVLSHENNSNYGHVCGTCRFGEDPADSVLDRNNRAHDLANLYVVDASFFPSSGGTNPSLTIAANALRVAAVIGDGPRSTRVRA